MHIHEAIYSVRRRLPLLSRLLRFIYVSTTWCGAVYAMIV